MTVIPLNLYNAAMIRTDTAPSFRFCVAPMLDWTDRHERYFLRLLSRHARLYTEMVTTGALIHGDRQRFLCHDPVEQPVALQLGGCVSDELARCAAMAEEAGFNEVNLNVGCPSDRVQSGRFGACLMADPALVAAGVQAMCRATTLPVTVKTRIGIDEQDSDAFLQRFIEPVAEAGCRHFILHARCAWLKGLSPKENRDIPPLNRERVLRMKQRYPSLRFVINGGITTLDESGTLLESLDGVMLGREVYQNPWLLSAVDHVLFGEPDDSQRTRGDIIRAFLPHVRRELELGTPLQRMTRHILGLYRGVPGGRRFRRHLSENAHRPGAGIEVLEDALALTEPAVLCKEIA
ncbi:MAG: tRNA dihydrouridine(20/20a) synthase DusA [Pseudohongiellaceae bacterium]